MIFPNDSEMRRPCRDLGSRVRERHGHTRLHPMKGAKMINDWSISPMRKGLRELGLFSLEKRRLKGDFYNV